ncbi:ATP-binding protein [Pleionea sp. CnH1-48]|uniref:ATP-binding protein n=1 Tax=Pleionea sp. CnH1-48 TaxID=2954494 RepID=UPI002097B1E6|nr:ATP-binding protein [Pleionea sp. CnH1-48]MCO7226730.1 ATP-binding protein [Pleionea sp. CnH1-48]
MAQVIDICAIFCVTMKVEQRVLSQRAFTSFFYASLLGIIGIGLNYLSVPILPPIELISSPIVLMISVRALGLRYGLVTLIITMGHFCWLYESLYNPIIYTLECLFFYWGCRKGWQPILVDALYWLILGIPLVWFILTYIEPTDSSAFFSILLKQPVNGFIYILIADLILWFPAIQKYSVERIRKGAQRSLTTFYSEALTLLLFVPLMIVSLITQSQIQSSQLKDIRTLLVYETEQSSEKIESFLNEYRKAIENFAMILSNSEFSTQQQQLHLLNLHQHYGGFITMLMADRDGELILSSPSELAKNGLSVADREYFTHARDKHQPFLSDAFRGKGFGTDPIVAISAPFYDGEKQFNGIVEGSLNLYAFDLFRNEYASKRNVSLLVIGKNNRVIFSSKDLKLEYLTPVTVEIQSDELFGATALINRSNLSYSFDVRNLDNGWKVYSLHNTNLFWSRIRETFVSVSLVIIIAFFPVVGLAFALSRLSIRPIKGLIQQFKDISLTHHHRSLNKDSSLFIEIELLYEQFRQAKEELREAHHHEQMLLEQKLNAEKETVAKSEFLSRVSHEFRTPLNSILGNVQLILMEKMDQQLSKKLFDIEFAGKHLLALVDDLLELTKFDVGEYAVNFKPVELNLVIEHVFDMLQQMAQEHSISLSKDINLTEGYFVEVDELRIKQILINIVSNGIKYNSKNGTVEITSLMDGEHLIVAIKDNGMGISEEHHQQVFQPFQRLGQENSDIQGSGVGLALAYNLIQRMNGDIWFESKTGQGTTFYIQLNVLTPTSDMLIESDKVEHSLIEHKQLDIRNKSILYIEDNRLNYLILESWLNKFPSVSVYNAKNGSEALVWLGKNQPDIIFSDLGLPDISGLEVAKKIRQLDLFKKTPLIALTAEVTDKVREDCIEVGFDSFLTKPVEFTLVEKTLIDLGFFDKRE